MFAVSNQFVENPITVLLNGGMIPKFCSETGCRLGLIVFQQDITEAHPIFIA